MSMVVLQSTRSKTAPAELASMGSSTGNCECVSDMIFDNLIFKTYSVLRFPSSQVSAPPSIA